MISMHIDGETHIKAPQKRHGYIHYSCDRWHVVKSIKGKRYSLGAYNTFKEAESILQKANKVISEGTFEKWYNDYKSVLKEKHHSHLSEVKRKVTKK